MTVNGSATPGVADRVVGAIVTPAGSPETAIAVEPLPDAVSIREACCPAAPAVNFMLDGVTVRVGWLALLPPLLLLQEARPATSRLLAAIEQTLPKNR